MNKHIFKYEIPITGEIIELEVPRYSALCDIQPVGDKIYMWLLIDIHEDRTKKHLKIYGTGHQIINAEKLLFLKTVVMPNGLVWHVFSTDVS